MSLAGRAATQGARCTLYRPTQARQADASYRATYAPLRTLQVALDTPTAAVAQASFGAEVVLALRAIVPAGPPNSAGFGVLPDVQPQDGLQVETGPYAGRRFVVGPIADEIGRPRATHRAAALVEHADDFPLADSGA